MLGDGCQGNLIVSINDCVCVHRDSLSYEIVIHNIYLIQFKKLSTNNLEFVFQHEYFFFQLRRTTMLILALIYHLLTCENRKPMFFLIFCHDIKHGILKLAFKYRRVRFQRVSAEVGGLSLVMLLDIL